MYMHIKIFLNEYKSICLCFSFVYICRIGIIPLVYLLSIADGKSRVTISQRTVHKPFEQKDSTGHISKYLVDITTLRTTIKTRNTN